MKSWQSFAALAVVGSIVLAGCGGGGVLAPSAPEYRMVSVASSGTVAMYSVSSAGSMSQIGTTSTGYQFVSVEAVTDRLYASASNTDGIYSIGFSNDAPSSNSVLATASDSGSLLFKHPTKSALYAVVPAQNTIDQWTINANGSLTAMAPGSVGTDLSPRDMVFHPSGNYAYVVNRGSEVVRVYSIDSSGALSLIPGAAFSTNSHPVKLIMTDDGAHLYAMSEDNDISQFSIGGNGLLTPLAPQKTVYPMGNFRAAMTANNILSFYRESDEGIETFGRTGNGQLTNMSVANFATNSTTDVYRLPGQNLLMLLARGTGTSKTVAMGSNGVGMESSSASLPAVTVDVAFWEVP
ncbi:MAG: beta-propeller fold lactonase family protein [Fimbriimonadaceae bacterium]